MIEFLYNLVFFLVALGILVTFHEWGHFYAARKLGVKVLRFSVGFGKPLWRRVGKDGVEYVVAGIPLGGYVKMLDEREGNVAESERSQAFNRQALWKRNVIVFAGPLANFVLALVVYWLMFFSGTWVMKPIVAEPLAGSIAQTAGVQRNDQILKVDGQSVNGWNDVVWALVERLGESGQIDLEVLDWSNNQTKSLKLDISDWKVDDRRPDPLASLGLTQIDAIDPLVYELDPNGAAQQAGIKPRDRILQLNDTKISSFRDVQGFMQAVQSDQAISVKVNRDGQEQEFQVYPRQVEQNWLLGIKVYSYFEYESAGFIGSFKLAVNKTAEVIALTGTMFKKLIVGEVSTKSLGGPLSIAEGAGSSARGGWVYFLGFLGIISVNLGLINLLPVPMLDGGHLLFNAIEWLKGKPLSDEAQEYGLRIGMVLVLGLMAIALFNDIARL
ncbi:RIP metalloprotease RseP [Pleionea litopenaei]|uniref:Zinc metalloprotease n=1 Tax=Pleionea litopenaei TaxID=3070815 RepID=A0AA51X7C3_9GAMM|nr:RIP metalloprotease RseP [Pleionea sp. HL-JVS1]WMS86965.1 RIP metalloprotease RseP [Pleionea sp. HL-JVS1]